MSTRYNFHIDPGHGWLEVPLSELHRLDIAHQISSYSYTRGAWAYLEEDCDMARFCAAKEARGEAFEFIDKIDNDDSPIRKYARYDAPHKVS